MKQDFLKGRLPIVLTIIIIVLASLGFCRRCSTTESTLANNFVKPAGDTITVAIEMSPLTYTLRNDTASGFDYEILRAITRQHGVATKFYPIGELESAFQSLYDGDFDILIASMPSTNTLKKYFPVTDAVYIDKQVLVQRRDTASANYISSQDQLMGDTVWISEGSPFRTRLTNMTRELGDSIHIATKEGYSSEHLAIMTALGQIPRAVVSEAVGQRIAADYPELDISTPISLSHFQCWAVAPGDSTLLDSLNIWLNEFKGTPQFDRLCEQYLGD